MVEKTSLDSGIKMIEETQWPDDQWSPYFVPWGWKTVDRKIIINEVPSVSAVGWDDRLLGRDHSSMLPSFLWSQGTQSCKGISTAEDLSFPL